MPADLPLSNVLAGRWNAATACIHLVHQCHFAPLSDNETALQAIFLPLGNPIWTALPRQTAWLPGFRTGNHHPDKILRATAADGHGYCYINFQAT